MLTYAPEKKGGATMANASDQQQSNCVDQLPANSSQCTDCSGTTQYAQVTVHTATPTKRLRQARALLHSGAATNQAQTSPS